MQMLQFELDFAADVGTRKARFRELLFVGGQLSQRLVKGMAYITRAG